MAEPAVTVAARRGLRTLPRERGSPLRADTQGALSLPVSTAARRGRMPALAYPRAESSEKNRTELAKETRAGQGARAKRALAPLSPE